MLVDESAAEPGASRAVGRANGERGQALILMVFAMTIVLLIGVIVVDFGMAVDHRLVVQHAVSEGVREAQVTNMSTITLTKQQIADVTVGQSQGLLEPADVTVCYLDQNSNGDPGDIGDKVRVAVEYTYRFSVGGGEVMTAFGVPVPSILMNPSAVAALQTKVDGATPCP